MSKIIGVYKITNTINDKFYVGSSVDITKRWGEHKNKANNPNSRGYPLLSAIRKYGIEAFKFEVLEECQIDVLIGREQFYIDSLKPDYNIAPQAGTTLGLKVNEIGCANIKAAADRYRTGRTFVEIFGEERAKEIAIRQSEGRTGKRVGCDPWNKGVETGQTPWNKGLTGMEPWNKGVPMSEELYAKLLAAGFWEWTDEKRKNLSEALMGRRPWNKDMKMDEEWCLRASEWAKANFDPEHQAAMTEAARLVNTGTPRSDQTKKNISEGNLASEKRKAFAESLRGVPRDPEIGRKSGDAQRGKPREYLQGKPRPNNTSGHFGITWRGENGKWIVRFKNKKYGAFLTVEEALKRRDVVAAELGIKIA